MKKNEIRKLIDVDAFFEQIDEIRATCQCTVLDALEEYSRRNDVSIDFVAQIVKTHRGKIKNDLTEQCKTLNLINA